MAEAADQIAAAIQENLANMHYGEQLAARGITTVALNDTPSRSSNTGQTAPTPYLRAANHPKPRRRPLQWNAPAPRFAQY
ncbi:hypothetical protein [Mycobacterium avium]|uniref:hypothetical protein n=1 Tax=Mycobacterium avium TaxID=1764 RepID=UPI001155A215